MEYSRQRRRRSHRRRRRNWSLIELIFFGLAVLLALIMTLEGLIRLTALIGGDAEETVSTVTIGESSGEDSSAEGDGTGSEDGTEADTTDTTDTADTTGTTDISQYATDTGYGGQLYALLDGYPQAAYILRNLDAYPEDLLAFVVRFPEAMSYGAAYLDYTSMGLSLSTDLSEVTSRQSTVDDAVQALLDSQNCSMPLLLQWDSRWGYKSYGDGLLGYTGCGPTCLSMVSLYLTGWNDNDPYSVAQYAESNGYYVSGSGSAWTLMSEASAHFGVTASELSLDENEIISALREGHPVVCAMGPGDFTDNGHYIVLVGYDDEAFMIRDPNSPTNSARTWTFDEISDQIKNLWSFSASSSAS